MIEHLPSPDPDEEFRLYVNGRTRPGEAPPYLSVVKMPFPRFWTQARLAWEMLRRPPDVLFVPAHVIPAIHPAAVVTIHDLGYLDESASHPPSDVRRLKLATRWSASAASKIITPSETTRRDLIAHLGVDPNKIVTIAHGVDDRFSAAPRPVDEEIRSRLALPRRYVLTVGTIHPRKNVPVLARAVATLNARGEDCHLVIAGKRGWNASEVVDELAASGLGTRLMILDYVADADMAALYRGATAFCMPSRYEGVGLPVLEALATGIPTIVSDRGALPETLGRAGFVASADSSEAFARALFEVLQNATLRQELAHTGPAWATKFSWSTAATETLDVLRQVAEDRR